jgi:hypothetical protein
VRDLRQDILTDILSDVKTFVTDNVDVLARRIAVMEVRHRTHVPLTGPSSVDPSALSGPASTIDPFQHGPVPDRPVSSTSNLRIKDIAWSASKFSGLPGKDTLTSEVFLQYVQRTCNSPPDRDLLAHFPLFLAPSSPAANWFATYTATLKTPGSYALMGAEFIKQFPVPSATEISNLIEALRVSADVRPLNLLSQATALQQQAPLLVPPTTVFSLVTKNLPPRLRNALELDVRYPEWVAASTDLTATGGLGQLLTRAQALLTLRPEYATYTTSSTDSTVESHSTPVVSPMPSRSLGINLIAEHTPPEEYSTTIMGIQQVIQSLADRVEGGPPPRNDSGPILPHGLSFRRDDRGQASARTSTRESTRSDWDSRRIPENRQFSGYPAEGAPRTQFPQDRRFQQPRFDPRGESSDRREPRGSQPFSRDARDRFYGDTRSAPGSYPRPGLGRVNAMTDPSIEWEQPQGYPDDR